MYLQVERSLSMLKGVQSTFRLRLIRVYPVYIRCLLEDTALILTRAASLARSELSLLKRDVFIICYVVLL